MTRRNHPGDPHWIILPSHIEDITRREFVFGALGAALLIACGDYDDTEPAATGSGRFPLTVEHALGTTTIDTAPERVVALIDRDADTLLALGVTPVAIHSLYGFERGVGPWAEDELGAATPTVWQGREFDFEAIAAARPDLIVNATSGGEQEIYDLLSAIAPTIPLPNGALAWGATTEETTLLIAEALGRKADGAALLDGLSAYLAEQAARYPSFESKTVTYLDIYPGGISSYNQDHIVNSVMYQVGFEPNQAALDMPAGTTAAEVSPERLAEYDADVVLIYPFGRTLAELQAEIPTLASLNSAANGTQFVLEDLAFSNSSVLSIPYALDNLLPRIDAALRSN